MKGSLNANLCLGWWIWTPYLFWSHAASQLPPLAHCWHHYSPNPPFGPIPLDRTTSILHTFVTHNFYKQAKMTLAQWNCPWSNICRQVQLCTAKYKELEILWTSDALSCYSGVTNPQSYVQIAFCDYLPLPWIFREKEWQHTVNIKSHISDSWH